jgi:hypothetical protein
VNIQLLISIAAGSIALAVISPIIFRLITMLRMPPNPRRKIIERSLSDRLADERMANRYRIPPGEREPHPRDRGFPHELYEER